MTGIRKRGVEKRPVPRGMATSSRERLLSVLVVAMLLMAGFAVLRASENARALAFVEAMTVPWDPTFTPLDSAWDSSGNHAIVVGQDSAQNSNAWHYNAASGEWAQATAGAASSSPNTIYVGSGAGNHSATVQGGVDLASSGDTVYVWPGTYTERVVVEKGINIRGHDKSSTNLLDSGYGEAFYVPNAHWVNISGFTFTGFANQAIHLKYSENSTVSDCDFYDNGVGVLIEAHYNRVENCLFSSNNRGVMFFSSNNNTISGNTVSDNVQGILLEQYSSQNIIRDNMVTGNTDYSIHVYQSSSNTFRGNTLDNNYRGMWVNDSLSTDNLIYQNNFLLAYGNAAQWMARDSGPNLNTWHGGDPATGGKGGNFYQGYGGADRGDGVGGNFTVTGGSSDLYPWMEPSGWVPFFDRVVDQDAVSARVNDDVSNPQEKPAVAMGSDGSVNVVWQDRRSGTYLIYFARSTDGGKTFPFNTQVSNANTNQENPRIAVGSDGAIYVVWEDNRTTVKDIYFSKSIDGGITFTSDFRVNTVTANAQIAPDIALDANGYIYVVWQSYNSGTALEDIYFSRSPDFGSSFTSSVRLDETNGNNFNQLAPSLAAYQNGLLYVTYSMESDFAQPFAIFLIRSINQGTNWGSVKLVSDYPPLGDAYSPRVAARGSDIYVVWRDVRDGYWNVYFSRSMDDGANFGLDIRLNYQGTAMMPSLALNSKGHIYIAWHDNREVDDNLYFTKSVNRGATFLRDRQFTRQVEVGNRWNPSIAFDSSDNLYGAWRSSQNSGDVFCVRQTGAFQAIQPAITDVPSTGTVQVVPGTYAGSITITKTLSLIGADRDTTILDGGGSSEVIYLQGSHAKISGFTLRNAVDFGLYAYMSDNCTIDNNKVVSTDKGISVRESPDMLLSGNHLTGMTTGLILRNLGRTIVEDNTITYNTADGIYMEFANNSHFSGNNLSNNNRAFNFWDSFSCTVTGNLISYNTDTLHIYRNSQTIYRNNFIGNTNLPTFNMGEAAWDQGDPATGGLGGNHWSHYTSPDANGDGIVDTSLNLGQGNFDYYPWVQPSGWETYQQFIYQDLTGATWDSANKRFWLCGEIGGDSTVYYIQPPAMTAMVPLTEAPALSFRAIAADNAGGVMVGGDGLPGIYYYDGTQGHEITEASTGSMADWNVTGITFNPNDSRFYLVGIVKDSNPAQGVAFFTDPIPLGIGSKCYRDTRTPGAGGFKSIAWNPSANYGLAVGGGVHRVGQYDGNPSYELPWTLVKGVYSGISYSDVSWDPHQWNEAAIVGQNQTFGNYWRYYHTNPQLIQGHKDPLSGTMYRTCAFKPPSSAKWVLIPASGGGVKINVEEKYEGGDIILDVNYPHIFEVRFWKSSDDTMTSLWDRQVDANATYTFLIEGNYVVSGTDRWNELNITFTAWHDGGNLDSTPGDPAWTSNTHRNSQFNISYSVASDTATVLYPEPSVSGMSEFSVLNTWQDPNTYGTDMRHRVMVNITFGSQTRAADGNSFPNLPDPMGNIWSKSAMLNDPHSWDMMVDMRSTVVTTAYNRTYGEFGIKEYATIFTMGASPLGSAPPGTNDFILSNPSQIQYSINTEHRITLSIPDLYLDGNELSLHFVPATNLSVRNTHGLASGNSGISDRTGFPGPGMPLYVWGASALYIPAPMNGTQSAGPQTDFNAGFMMTEVVWWVNIPAATREGQYRGTITLTLSNT